MKRRILALCMAMCMMATTVFTGSVADGMVTAYAAEQAATITVSAYDYTAVKAGISGASATGVIMEQKVTAEDGETTAETIARAFAEAGISQSGVESSYVTSINGLGSNGGYSGWCMSYNNDDYSNGGISAITLSDGDTIRFDYTNNADTTTDDIGNGWYGKPIVTDMTIGEQTVSMSKSTTNDENYNASTTYYIDGEAVTAEGTESDPFVFEFELSSEEASSAEVALEVSLDEHYAVMNGIDYAGGTYDLSSGLDFSVSSLGGTSKSYYRIEIASETNNASDSYKEKLDDTIKYIRKVVTEPVVSSTGGEWAVLTLARYGYEDPEWYTTYYNNVVAYVRKNGSSKLHSRKGTDNSRVILALSAIGADPTNVAGYNLLQPLADYDYVIWQGVNGPVYALIAFDTCGYDIPELPEGSTATQTTRENLIKRILDLQLSGGGWAISGTAADPDMTTMTIQSLAPYYGKVDGVKEAVDNGMAVISKLQKDNGGFASWGTINSESCAQTICALADLDRDADTDSDYVKNGNSVLDAMLGFYIDGGGFAHAATNGVYKVNQMASEQAAYALVAYDRYKNGKNTLYDMTDNKVLYTVDTSKPNLSDASVIIGDYDDIYDGNEKNPEITVKYGDMVLSEGTDYTVEITDNTEIGSAKVKVTAAGDSYEGEKETTFPIYYGEITEDDIQMSDAVIYSDGTGKLPDIVVTHDGETLVEDVDYTLKGSNNVLPSSNPKVTISGIGRYKGTIVKNFVITRSDLSTATVKLSSDSYIYDGTAKTPEVTVECNGVTVKSSYYSVTYSDNTEIGTAKVAIALKGMGKNYYTGEASAEFEIKKIDISGAVVTAGEYDKYANGEAKTPEVTVVLGDKTLTAGTDYTAAYTENVNAGTAKVVVTGTGIYTGEASAEFEIKKIDISSAVVTVGEYDKYANGEAKTPEVTVVLGDKTLTAGTDYTAAYTDNVNAGTAKVTVTGTGNYEGSAETTFVIDDVAANVTSAVASAAKVTIKWSRTEGIETYAVYRKAEGDDDFTELGTTTSVSYIDASVKEGVTYTYEVRPLSGTVYGVSNAVSVTVIGTTRVNASNVRAGMYLTWNKTVGAEKYIVLRKDTKSTSWKVVGTTASLSYIDKTVKNGTRYVYAVKPAAGNGRGSFTTKTIYRLDKPVVKLISSPAKANIKVSYGKNSAASGYQIMYATNKSFKNAGIKTISKNSTLQYSFRVLKSKTRYYVRVRSYKKVGNTTYYGAWSDDATVVTR